MSSVIYRDIQAAAPRRALDAGAGKLKNFFMFPRGSYHGLGLDKAPMEQALESMTDVLAQRAVPTMYAMDLNEDFHSIGPFDLVVCTGTTAYLADPVDCVRRLALLLNAGGTLLFDMATERFPQLAAGDLGNLFENVTYFAYDCLGIPESPADIARDILGAPAFATDLCDFAVDLTDEMKNRLFKLSRTEMETNCEISAAKQLYVSCRGRTQSYEVMENPTTS